MCSICYNIVPEQSFIRTNANMPSNCVSLMSRMRILLIGHIHTHHTQCSDTNTVQFVSCMRHDCVTDTHTHAQSKWTQRTNIFLTNKSPLQLAFGIRIPYTEQLFLVSVVRWSSPHLHLHSHLRLPYRAFVNLFEQKRRRTFLAVAWIRIYEKLHKQYEIMSPKI